MDRDLEVILLKARDNIYSILNGGNLSNRLGEGYNFAELREYNIGDDIRQISWINSAKFGEPYIKKMYEERALNIAICSLVDGRFLIGEKIKTVSYISAILGYSAIAQNSSFLPISIFGSRVKVEKRSKEFEAVYRYVDSIYKSNLLGIKVNYKNVQEVILNAIQVKSMIFIIGDFLDTIDLSILAQKHEIVVIIVRDRVEENPLISNNYQLINPQTEQIIDKMVNKRAIEYYKAKLIEHDSRLIDSFNSQNIRYTKIYNVDEVVEKLRGIEQVD